MKKINKKLEYNTELMVITMEECGELIEACSSFFAKNFTGIAFLPFPSR